MKNTDNEILAELWKTTGTRGRVIIEGELIKKNKRFLTSAVYSVIKTNKGNYDDYLNEVMITVIEALRTYDTSRGVKFLSWWGYNMHGALTKSRPKIEGHPASSLDKPDNVGEPYKNQIPFIDDNSKFEFYDLLNSFDLTSDEKIALEYLYYHKTSLQYLGDVLYKSREWVRKEKNKGILKLRKSMKVEV